MNIGIYHPNLHLYGGGEYLIFTLAAHLQKHHNVTFITHTPVDIKKAAAFFGFKIDCNLIIDAPFYADYTQGMRRHVLLHHAYRVLNSFDLVIDSASNGWFDRKLTPKTLCYVHYPVFDSKKRGIRRLLNPWIVDSSSAFCYDTILCNSNFTKQAIQGYTSKDVHVVYPPVDTSRMKISKKELVITTVGRFHPEKKHDVLIRAFAQFSLMDQRHWLHIIGTATSQEDFAYLAHLKSISKGLRVAFHVNMPHEQVVSFLEKSSIYWHARGYGESNPQSYENFGITTVEAMAARCIPIVINLGAQPEIVEHSKNGFCWNTPEELIALTHEALLAKNQILRSRAANAAKMFSKEHFLRAFDQAIIATYPLESFV